MTIDAKDIEEESDLVFLMPTCLMPRYVRQSLVFATRRRGRIDAPENGHTLGWANLLPDARDPASGMILRRVFWMSDHDPYTHRGAPVEAVDPLTLSAGEPGRMTSRAWGIPKEEQTA